MVWCSPSPSYVESVLQETLTRNDASPRKREASPSVTASRGVGGTTFSACGAEIDAQ